MKDEFEMLSEATLTSHEVASYLAEKLQLSGMKVLHRMQKWGLTADLHRGKVIGFPEWAEIRGLGGIRLVEGEPEFHWNAAGILVIEHLFREMLDDGPKVAEYVASEICRTFPFNDLFRRHAYFGVPKFDRKAFLESIKDRPTRRAAEPVRESQTA